VHIDGWPDMIFPLCKVFIWLGINIEIFQHSSLSAYCQPSSFQFIAAV